MISIYPQLTEATRTIQPYLRAGRTLVVDAGVTGWFHLYLMVEGDPDMGLELTKIHKWMDLDPEIQNDLQQLLLGQNLSAFQQMSQDATVRMTKLGFHNMVVETYICDSETWAEYNKQGDAAGLAFLKTHGIGVSAEYLKGEKGTEILIHEWAHWYMRQMPKAEEERIKAWYNQSVQPQINTPTAVTTDDLRYWVDRAVQENFRSRFHMPLGNFLEIADRVWDYREDITDTTIPEDLLGEVGFLNWQNLAFEGVRVFGKFKKSVPLVSGKMSRKGMWGFITGLQSTYTIVAASAPLTDFYCVNPETGAASFTAEEVEEILAIDLEKTAHDIKNDSYQSRKNLTISTPNTVYRVLNYLQPGSNDTLAEGLWANKQLVLDSIFNDLLTLTGKAFKLRSNGVEIWDELRHEVYLQLVEEGDTAEKIIDVFTKYAVDCFVENEEAVKSRVAKTGITPSRYGATNYKEFFSELIAHAALGHSLSQQMKTWLRDFIRGDFQESHRTKELNMSQQKTEIVTEALTFDKRVMRELSRKDSLVRMFAKDQPLDILFTTLVVGDSGLESKYIEIAKTLGADVGIKESVDSLPQKWEISFCNLTEQHIARLGQYIHTKESVDSPYMKLPGSAVPVPISAVHVDNEHGTVSFRVHTVSERIARLVMDEMQKVLDGKTE